MPTPKLARCLDKPLWLSRRVLLSTTVDMKFVYFSLSASRGEVWTLLQVMKKHGLVPLFDVPESTWVKQPMMGTAILELRHVIFIILFTCSFTGK